MSYVNTPIKNMQGGASRGQWSHARISHVAEHAKFKIPPEYIVSVEMGTELYKTVKTYMADPVSFQYNILDNIKTNTISRTDTKKITEKVIKCDSKVCQQDFMTWLSSDKKVAMEYLTPGDTSLTLRLVKNINLLDMSKNVLDFFRDIAPTQLEKMIKIIIRDFKNDRNPLIHPILFINYVNDVIIETYEEYKYDNKIVNIMRFLFGFGDMTGSKQYNILKAIGEQDIHDCKGTEEHTNSRSRQCEKHGWSVYNLKELPEKDKDYNTWLNIKQWADIFCREVDKSSSLFERNFNRLSYYSLDKFILSCICRLCLKTTDNEDIIGYRYKPPTKETLWKDVADEIAIDKVVGNAEITQFEYICPDSEKDSLNTFIILYDAVKQRGFERKHATKGEESVFKWYAADTKRAYIKKSRRKNRRRRTKNKKRRT